MNPAVTNLLVRPLHSRPGNPMRPFLPLRVPVVRRKCVVERLAIDVLRMRRKMMTHRRWQIGIIGIWHNTPPLVGNQVAEGTFCFEPRQHFVGLGDKGAIDASASVFNDDHVEPRPPGVFGGIADAEIECQARNKDP